MTAEEFGRAAEVLRAAPAVAIACHVNPDADALGSMLGLAHHLVARGVDVDVRVPERASRCPAMGGRAPRTRAARAVDRFPAAPDVMVTCDCAAFDRLGALGAAATRRGS